MKQHIIPDYFLNPTHRITVNVIGCGGTGSQVLHALARFNEALIGLNHPGFFVTVFDGDRVNYTNIGRQLFSPADIGRNKAVVSVTRVNRFFGYDWEAVPRKYNQTVSTQQSKANITISCVDSVASRIEISKLLRPNKRTGEPNTWQYYWMDYGNQQKTGQVVLGTVGTAYSPRENTVNSLADVVKLFPALKKLKDVNSGPSCSLAQALGKQDLFINSTLAQLGMNILWKLFREGRINYHGCYLNLDTMSVNPIKI